MTGYKEYTAMNVSRRDSGQVNARGTVRIDTARKILRNGWTDAVVKDHEMTDDYKRDMANDFYSNKDVTESDLLEKLKDETDDVQPKRIWVEEMQDGRQILIFYWSFKEYRAELNTSKVRFSFD